MPLVEINETIIVEASTAKGGPVATASHDPAPDADDSPGYIEVLAETEPALPRLLETVEAFPGVLETKNAAMNRASEAATRSDAAGNGFAARVVAAHTLAVELMNRRRGFSSSGRVTPTSLLR